MSDPILPPELNSAGEYIAAIQQLEGEIHQAERHLGRLKRLRGIRVFQLEKFQEERDLKR
jgi:hypothetical protein